MKIERLNWDSEFFGYSIGKLTLVNKEKPDESIMDLLKPYKLIYVFTESSLPPDFPGALVDTKILFEKTITENSKPIDTIVGFDSNYLYEELLELAFLSGTYSRFKTDQNFKRNEFSKLYKEWIDKSLANDNICTLIKPVNRHVGGFITVDLNNQYFAQIGLVAVSDKYQGKGIGSLLLSASEYLAYKKGFSKIKVATQKLNTAAMNLYSKNGYVQSSSTFIYHLWM
ncbi:MAG: GNAT family N-acetyltransferase [Salinivirgaceae bacterium]|jgi:dTDP-4-amino-4,6-dideoxy-D-galactose acyltransferase|nr:GNAT family N-acetyltransferase [Salinivirgaceae bacterium]